MWKKIKMNIRYYFYKFRTLFVDLCADPMVEHNTKEVSDKNLKLLFPKCYKDHQDDQK